MVMMSIIMMTWRPGDDTAHPVLWQVDDRFNVIEQQLSLLRWGR